MVWKRAHSNGSMEGHHSSYLVIIALATRRTQSGIRDALSLGDIDLLE